MITFNLKNETATPIGQPGKSLKKPHFFTYTEEPDTAHGRFDQRNVSVYSFEPLEVNLPGARSLTVIRRTRTTDPEEVPKLAFYTPRHHKLPGYGGCVD